MENSRIVIVDDDPNIGELVAVNLQAAGYPVKTAINGREALELIQREKPELIVLDVMMPEIDGWEVCKAVRDDPDLTRTKILLLTARDTDRDRMIGKDILGADEYMTKPFEIEELVGTVRRLLNG